ncbi:DUF2197 domain-containing protein [uncultured Rummeliibacillus sp.]|uniref:DUF2197 domain-containing protein n=1 Tax=uncultured Rummeliibacillus sp. TaxID=762292 RepID=UPI000E665015|nr:MULTISPECIES: DUF2197 domain-containing protein [unclassified Rummeliibacillus]RIJ64694.1 DUF2197 domain-containing protein [Rummeliibacillus sp. POC4]RPJ97321.1 DUF2197 domain-containing protein [Rummeliibacillus sp. TYF005]
MLFYSVVCNSCRRNFQLAEGSLAFRMYKGRKSQFMFCEDCHSKVRVDAVKNVLNASDSYNDEK